MRISEMRQAHMRLFRRFRKDNEGATVVEFAMVALPFFALLFAIFETAMVFFAGQILDSGVSQAARMIRTGQVQDQGVDETMFKQLVCANVYGLLDCDGGLRVDVRRLNNFSESFVPPPVEDGEFKDDNFVFQPGVGGDIVLVRGFYEWPIILPNLGGPSNLASGNFLLSAASTFRNEPF